MSEPSGEMLPAAELAPDVNDRACMLVLTSIAKYPQSWEGTLIAADAAMDELTGTGEAHSATGIGMYELARVDPDGGHYAGVVNGIHDQFGIPNRVSPIQARQRIIYGAGCALNYILISTRQNARILGLTPPEKGSFLSHEVVDGVDEYSIDASRVDQLTAMLTAVPLLSRGVARHMRIGAANIKADSSRQQHKMQLITELAIYERLLRERLGK